MTFKSSTAGNPGNSYNINNNTILAKHNITNDQMMMQRDEIGYGLIKN